jgi:Flp pilus assembly protein TadD
LLESAPPVGGTLTVLDSLVVGTSPHPIALLFARRNAEASAMFREAIARVPTQAEYCINLCVSLHLEGKTGDALAVCNAVASKNPIPEQRAKANQLIAKIRAGAP